MTTRRLLLLLVPAVASFATPCPGQQPPYDTRPAVAPPYWRVRYKAAKEPGGLLFPSYEQPEAADCQMWCDPRNGSAAAFTGGAAVAARGFAGDPLAVG
ncbi:MAG: hypothetical protein O3A18_03410 [Planctomycetota bacterium]|jgi:hypothetical protein|nr:hypothetical protein [Planctomycetota bacterium]